MTFRSISNNVSRKVNSLKKGSDSQNQIDLNFKEFLNEVFGNTITSQIKFVLDYFPDKKRLIIQTESKVFANELVLKLELLSKYFKKEKIEQIIIK